MWKLLPLLFTCLACSRVQPLHPATGQPLVSNSAELSHLEKITLQEEIIKRQEQERVLQKQELLDVQRQEHYNLLSERYKTE